MEKKTQQRLIKHLKRRGCFVMAITVVPGIPTGTPDVFFCKEGFYGFAEVKSSRTAKYRPLQKEQLKKLNDWSWAKAVYPENYDEIKEELDKLLI